MRKLTNTESVSLFDTGFHVPDTILEQLGFDFLEKITCSNFVSSELSIVLKLSETFNGINRISIELNTCGVYELSFYYDCAINQKACYTDVSCGTLHDIIDRELTA